MNSGPSGTLLSRRSNAVLPPHHSELLHEQFLNLEACYLFLEGSI